MRLAKPLVIGGMVAVMVLVAVLMLHAAELSRQRDLLERVALFRDHSYRSEAQLRACLLDQRRDGLALKRSLFKDHSDDLINPARHTLVRIENRGDFRIIRAWRRGEQKLRPGEILHLLGCLDRPAG